MLSTICLVAAGLTTGHKIGLALVGAAFIVFALVCSFVLPRRNEDFPGRFVPAFVAVGVLFVVAMLAAVLIFGKEKDAKVAGESPVATVEQSQATPQGGANGGTGGSTTTTVNPGGAMQTAPSTGGSGGSAAQGDPVAGKKVFLAAGCTGCHTLKDAGSTGNVGPNLDQLKPSYAAVHMQVINGGGAMPAFKGQLTPVQINDVSAYVSSVAGK